MSGKEISMKEVVTKEMLMKRNNSGKYRSCFFLRGFFMGDLGK